MDDAPDRRSARERMLAGELYRADDPELVALARRADRLVRAYNGTGADEPERREALLRELLGSVGAEVTIRPPFYCDYGSQIRIGDRAYLNVNTVLLDVATIEIGADVQIGPNVQLLTPHHPVEPEPRREKWEAARPIVIGDNVWLGGGVIVLGGVTIGADTVVGAGSVVTRDLPPGVVAVGNPARVLRRIDGAPAASA
ncbi:sugar O-acetyltransferase [Micromonospora sp. HM5-17]|jgi:maltose O-acetyltransferase|uniref:sugar O-acetyltransferase n=1 Tax=Micromonospora sp. HM5-17 TaxID=2487710 RepID=UPI000F48956E|nr:sugar O-acetyltransferase [Micromonospora sp. HM5-17]ROT32207.1 sugar O-acetyltransferase [Micromonospora sp. HM5-17]